MHVCYAYILHTDEQPSKLAVFPSSQLYEAYNTPFPHVVLDPEVPLVVFVEFDGFVVLVVLVEFVFVVLVVLVVFVVFDTREQLLPFKIVPFMHTHAKFCKMKFEVELQL